MAPQPAATIDQYIAGFPAETQRILQQLRALVHEVSPGATERISYAIPTFDLRGSLLIAIAGWKHHIGLYPVTGRVAEALAAELATYKMGRGSVQLPLVKPMPLELVRRIVELRAAAIGTD